MTPAPIASLRAVAARLLHNGCVTGNAVRVARALSLAAPLDVLNKHNLNALQLACRAGHEHIVRILLDAGANVNAFHPRTHTALYYACKAQSVACVCALVRAGVDACTNEVYSLMWTACLKAHNDAVRDLIDAGVLATANKEECLLSACIVGNHIAMRMFLDAGACPHKCDKDGNTVMERLTMCIDIFSATLQRARDMGNDNMIVASFLDKWTQARREMMTVDPHMRAGSCRVDDPQRALYEAWMW